MQDDTRLQSAVPPSNRGWVGMGVGAGVLGAAMLALRWLIRPPTTARVPESISPWFFSTHALQSSRGQMIYHESGSGLGPTLVFIHDLEVGASSYEWSKIYTAFADGHRVLAVDLIGFGESDRPKYRLSGEDYAASLAEFLDVVCGGNEHGRQPIVVVASGMGGAFATLLAARRPEVVSRLILWMPTGSASAPWYLNLATRLPTVNRFVYRNLLARRSALRRRLAVQSLGLPHPEISPDAVEVRALCAQQYQAEFAIYHWLQGRLDVDLDAALLNVKVPVTLLWPERISPPSDQQAVKLAAKHRLCSLRRLPGTGPLALLEVPGEVSGVLKDELRSDLRVLKAG